MDLSTLIKKQRPNIKDNSLKSYLISLNKIHENYNKSMDKENTIIKNLNFLKDRKNILTIIDNENTLTTKKNRLTAILVALGLKEDDDDFLNVKKKYADDLFKLTTIYNNEIKGKKTEKEEKNWATMKELLKIPKLYKKEINDLDLKNREKDLSVKQKLLLQYYILSLLYTKLEPIRLDYNVDIVDKEEDIEPDKNYLVNIAKNNKYFVIQDHKTDKTDGMKVIVLDKEINNAINLWLEYNKTGFLFINNRNTRQSSNGLGKMINNAFKPTKKNITLNLIRKIYISENVDKKAVENAKNIAKSMGHSLETQQLVYHKN